MQEQPEEQKKRRGLRLFFILGATILGTGAIGFGGLALWTVTTQNNGNQFATGSVHHSNTARLNGAGAPIACTDVTSPGPCGVIYTIANAGPGDSITGNVTLVNTGTRNSTFTLGPGTGANAQTASPAGSNLCNDLNLTIVDNNPIPVTVYNGSLSAFSTTANLGQAAGSNTWAPGDQNRFTFTVTLPIGTSNVTDMSAACTGGFLWSQTG